MPQTRTAYMPLATYPEPVPDDAIAAAVALAAAVSGALQVTTFAVRIPQMSSPLGGMLIDVAGLARVAEEKSRAESQRLQEFVQKTAGGRVTLAFSGREVILGATLDAAAEEARYFDLAVLPWSADSMGPQDMTQAVIFGSGRPTILVPPTARIPSLDHIAIAWDASRVAARALGDALSLLAPGGRVTVLTVTDEKPLGEADLAGRLALALEQRGLAAAPVRVALTGRSIAGALQDAAVAEGAQLLAMGGFGHSRIRDFILGGATRGVLGQLLLPTLISH